MVAEGKITEIFCMADDFCKFFDTMVVENTLKAVKEIMCHRDFTMSQRQKSQFSFTILVIAVRSMAYPESE